MMILGAAIPVALVMTSMMRTRRLLEEKMPEAHAASRESIMSLMNLEKAYHDLVMVTKSSEFLHLTKIFRYFTEEENNRTFIYRQ